LGVTLQCNQGALIQIRELAWASPMAGLRIKRLQGDQASGCSLVLARSAGLCAKQRLWVYALCAVFVTGQAASRLRVMGIVHQKALQ
jgi:hypothetical protein